MNGISIKTAKAILDEYHSPGHAVLELRTRFHKNPIPIPETVIAFSPVQEILILKKLFEYRKKDKPCLVFAPTINQCENLFQKLNLLAKSGFFIHSKAENREQILSDFKKGKYKYLVTTSVLERGVTVKNLQVLVYHADEKRVYDSSTLIQIAGRAGRKMDAPSGEVIFYGEKGTNEMADAIKEIEFCNNFL